MKKILGLAWETARKPSGARDSSFDPAMANEKRPHRPAIKIFIKNFILISKIILMMSDASEMHECLNEHRGVAGSTDARSDSIVDG